jgi:hypothetical protein
VDKRCYKIEIYYNDRYEKKNKNNPIPIVFIASLTKFNRELKYSSRWKVGIVKLDIQTCNSNFKLMVGKLVSKYKINNITSNYLAMISPLSLQMPEEEDRLVKPIPHIRRK